jgi:hypothetical protein
MRTKSRISTRTVKLDPVRTFGVEIEVQSSEYSEDVARELREHGIPCRAEGYNHYTREHWKIVPDDSVREGFELVSPPLAGRDGLRQVEIVLSVLNGLDVWTDGACGLHVHHDARDFDIRAWRALAKAAVKYEGTLDELVAYDRRSDHWACGSLRRGYTHAEMFSRIDACESIHDVQELWWGDRYLKVNFAAFGAHGTVEFRQHQGTTDFVEIAAWLSLTQGLVTRAVSHVPVTLKRTHKPFDSLMWTAGASAAVRNHYAPVYEPARVYAERRIP